MRNVDFSDQEKYLFIYLRVSMHLHKYTSMLNYGSITFQVSQARKDF